MQITTKEQFMSFYGFDKIKPISYDYFLNNFRLDTKNRHILLTEYIKNKVWGDVRDNHDFYFRVIYDFFYKDPQMFLGMWYEQHISCDVDVSDLYFDLNVIDDGEYIYGKKYANRGRIIKNIFFNEIYAETHKSSTLTHTYTTLEFIKSLYFDNVAICVVSTSPFLVDIFKRFDYKAYNAVLRGLTSKASVFNPYTYYYIIKTKLKPGKVIFTPVLSWCTPVIAFHNIDCYEKLIVCDVIPRVIDKSKELHDFMNDNKTFLQTKKDFDFYCCPSERLDERYGFSEKYKGMVDTVFFSPPYFDLEVYPGGEQSIDSFKTYNEWLIGYWEATCKLCYNVLKVGGQFSFVIVDEYSNKDGVIEISKDMLNIAKKYFKFDKTLKLSWGGFSSGGVNCAKRRNVVEDIHILERV